MMIMDSLRVAEGKRILLAEDEPGLVLTLTDRLESEGYTVEVVRDGAAALEQGKDGAFDLILLDVGLPKKNGFDVCRDLRQLGVAVPVLMLTARGDVTDRVVGLKLGADDYLTKPFEMIELLARIEALIRRTGAPVPASSGAYRFGDIEVDFKRAEVHRGGTPIELSALEFKLLSYFLEHRGDLLTRKELLKQVWGHEALLHTRTVDVHVAWLRQKLEVNPSHPQFITTIHRRGYKFNG
jgi:two-component system alkaline phosphatase synthesis response regulator PhoP